MKRSQVYRIRTFLGRRGIRLRRLHATLARPAVPDDAVSGVRLTLFVTYFEGRKHSPIIELRRAAQQLVDAGRDLLHDHPEFQRLMHDLNS